MGMKTALANFLSPFLDNDCDQLCVKNFFHVYERVLNIPIFLNIKKERENFFTQIVNKLRVF